MSRFVEVILAIGRPVKVTYNPERLSLEKLTHAFFMVIDPTVQNRQGPDIGTQLSDGCVL